MLFIVIDLEDLLNTSTSINYQQHYILLSNILSYTALQIEVTSDLTSNDDEDFLPLNMPLGLPVHAYLRQHKGIFKCFTM